MPTMFTKMSFVIPGQNALTVVDTIHPSEFKFKRKTHFILLKTIPQSC